MDVKADQIIDTVLGFLFMGIFIAILSWGLTPPSVSGEGVPAQTYTPHVDIAKYDMWAPPDSSYICDRDGNCAWLPDGTILLTPRPETAPPTNYY